jgi:hypothetical protein
VRLHDSAGRRDADGRRIQFHQSAYIPGDARNHAPRGASRAGAYSRGLDRFLEDIRDDSFWNALSGRLRAYVPQWPSWEGNGWTDNFVECCGIENIYVLGSRDPSFVGQSFVSLA